MKLSIDCWTKLQKWYLGKTKYYCKNILNVTCVISCNPVCNIFVLFFFMVQFFTMHETLHTYRFWVFGEKTPSLLFMLREEELPFITIMSKVFRKVLKLRRNILQSCTSEINIVSPCDLAWFAPFSKRFPEGRRSHAAWCMMLMLCKKWCDDVMLCKVIFRRYTHICAIKHNLFVNQRWLFAISLP